MKSQVLKEMNFFHIPSGLPELLKNFTLTVLREQPADLYQFAFEYFSKERESRNNKKCPMYVIVDDDEAGEPEGEEIRKSSTRDRYTRRRSVAAESFNPEDSDSGDEPVIFPKTDSQRKRLMQAVKEIILFKSLEHDQILEVIDAMFERKVKAGDEVITHGDDGDNFYVIDHGTYDVLVGCDNALKQVYRFEDQGSFGELALMYNQPRSASVLAVTDGQLWAMDRNSFRRIVLKSTFKKRKMYENLLAVVPILKCLDEYERMNVADALLQKKYSDGDCVIKEGDGGDGMYFIEQGQAKVTVRKNGVETEVSYLSAGQYFGELALIEDKPRSANVYADGDVKLAFLERESFERLLGPCVTIMLRSSENYTRTE